MPDGAKNYFDPKVLAGISNLALRARWVVEGLMSGVHRSRSKGFSVEFEEHREYSPGDEIRRIDWKALGKFDRYFIKEYEDETNLRAYLLFDASASMNYASDGITKFDYGCTLAASLAYLILKQQDAAGVVTFSDHIESFVPPRAKRDYLTQILRALEKRGPAGETNVGKILEDIAGQVKRRGLIVLVSDLLDEPEAILKGLRQFRFKGNDVIVFHLLDQAELDLPFDGNILFEDLEATNLQVIADPRTIRNDLQTGRAGIHRRYAQAMPRQRHRLSNHLDRDASGPGPGQLSELERLARRMSVFFLYPLFLLGLFAASLPVLIHLLNRRKLKTNPLSRRALHPALTKTHLAQLSFAPLDCFWRSELWRSYFSRCLLANPIFQTGAGLFAGGGPVALVVLLDNSLSMTWSGDGNGFKQAKDAARMLISALNDDDRAAIVPTNLSGKELFRLKGQKDVLLQRIG